VDELIGRKLAGKYLQAALGEAGEEGVSPGAELRAAGGTGTRP
jgi:hypothetical protein